MLASLLCIVSVLATVPVLALDEDGDTLDDAIVSPGGSYLPDAAVAVVNVGSSVSDYQARLTTAGYTSTLIPISSDLSVLSQYDLVLLPVSHATPGNYETLNGLAADYHTYMADGGKLWIGQPNPYGMPGNTADITWGPYALTVYYMYDSNDCPSVIMAPDHCIAEGISGSDLPFPGDTVTDMAADWLLIAEGSYTGAPSVLIATYGNGACLVELGHPSPNAICPYTDAGFYNMITCLLDEGPTPAVESSWGNVKSLFK